jgi:hypothetical protein
MPAPEITELLVEIRQFLEPYWLVAHQGWGDIPDPLSRWMCRYTSLFLATVLRETYCDTDWQIIGGRPAQAVNATAQTQVGIFACDGTWNDHCWVEGDGRILDLTADQFGYSPVIVTAISDRRYRSNLTERDMAENFQKLQHRPIKWLGEWKR